MLVIDVINGRNIITTFFLYQTNSYLKYLIKNYIVDLGLKKNYLLLIKKRINIKF